MPFSTTTSIAVTSNPEDVFTVCVCVCILPIAILIMVQIYFPDPPKTQLDLKEAGSVVKPGRATGGQSALGSSVLQDELREDVYVLYEEEGEEEEGERGEGKGAGPDDGANGDTLNPSFIRCKL